MPRLRSTHAGGFVLSSEPLGDYMPIEETSMGRTILQFDKDDLDAAGVPKFDFLGLGGLSVVHLAFDAIQERTGEALALYRLPVDDPATYDMIAAGDTVGTFQIESRAQIQSIIQTRPERLYDIVVQVALIRPGPIQARFVQPYTRRRRGLEDVVYDDARLEPIVRRTYGIPIFQEQAMAISMALGGFSAAEADELRRAMGHYRKLPRLHAALQRLKVRMSGNGVAPETAAHIVEDLYSFANYGFPESHAWSFALIAYATAYLKRHYPAEFFLGLLNAWPMGFYPPATLVHQARRDGVTVLPPCLRDGGWDCSLEPDPEPAGHTSPRPDRSRHQQTDGATGRQEDRGKPARAALAVAERDARYADRSQGGRTARVAVAGNDPCDREGEDAREACTVPERGDAPEADGAPRTGVSQEPAARRAAGGTREPNPRTGGLQDPGRAGRASGVPARPITAASGAGEIGPESGLCLSERSERVRPDSAGRSTGGASRKAASGARRDAAARPARAPNVNHPARGIERAVGGIERAVGGAESTMAGAEGAMPGASRHGGVPPALRIGWRHIRGLGDRAKQALQDARADGPFTSVEDVVRRAHLTRAEALHLARAGAFEAFEPGRRRATWEALRAAGDTLPLAPARRLPFDPEELRDDELIFLDYLATGICVRGHPMEHLRARLRDAGVTDSTGLAGLPDGAPIVVAGLVVARQHPSTAKGVVFMLLEDEYGFINAVVMPPIYQSNRDLINESPFLLIEGRLEHDGAGRNVLARRFRRLRARPIRAPSHDYH